MACSGTVGDCSGGCGSGCTGHCTNSSGGCDSCQGFCGGGCYTTCGVNGCSTSCNAACSTGCSGGCTGGCSTDGCTSCTGCSGRCTGGCSTDGCTSCTGCSGGCTGCSGCSGCTGCTGCTGSCKGACNKGCSSTTQTTNYNAVLNMSELIKASDVNYLRAFINYEVKTRRGKTLSTNSDAVKDNKILAQWWNQLQVNLAKCISVGGTATVGNKITTVTRQELIEKAITLYDTVIGKD